MDPMMFIGLIQAQQSAAAAQQATALGKEQFDWAKSEYEQQKPLIYESAEAQLDAQKQANAFAKQQQDFYTGTYQPLEADYVQRVQNWDSPERIQQQAGRAQGMVAQQFEQARDAARANLESYGIDPSATRYAALDIGTRTGQAAATAAAGNQAIEQAQLQGMGLRAGAINTGRGYSNDVTSALGTATQAGAGAAAGLTGGLQAGSQALAAPANYYSAAAGNMNASANALGNVYKPQQSSGSSGLGALLGAGAGLATQFLEDGGPVEMQGGAIPDGASPSQGAIPDDIPARLSKGEFIIPEPVVRWLGVKSLYSLIEKATQEQAKTQATTTAQPQMRQAIPAAPAVVSRSSQPQMQAIPA